VLGLIDTDGLRVRGGVSGQCPRDLDQHVAFQAQACHFCCGGILLGCCPCGINLLINQGNSLYMLEVRHLTNYVRLTLRRR
jgi:hypothetical protein